MIVVVALCIGRHAHAAQVFLEYEATIAGFMKSVSGCSTKVKVTSAELAAKLYDPADLEQIRPKSLPTDIDVIADLELCDHEDRYGFRLRKNEDSHAVIGYSSYSQPE